MQSEKTTTPASTFEELKGMKREAHGARLKAQRGEMKIRIVNRTGYIHDTEIVDSATGKKIDLPISKIVIHPINAENPRLIKATLEVLAEIDIVTGETEIREKKMD